MPRTFVRGAEPPFDPWGTINPTVATQLQNKGVQAVVNTRFGIVGPELGTVGGTRSGLRGPNAAFIPGLNKIVYNPTTTDKSGLTGVMQHEMVHAAASNIHPARLGSLDPRMAAQYVVGNAARSMASGRATPNLLAMAAAKYVVPNTFNRLMGQWTGVNYAAEGLAGRGVYPDIKKWGDRVRNYIVPNPR